MPFCIHFVFSFCFVFCLLLEKIVMLAQLARHVPPPFLTRNSLKFNLGMMKDIFWIKYVIFRCTIPFAFKYNVWQHAVIASSKLLTFTHC